MDNHARVRDTALLLMLSFYAPNPDEHAEVFAIAKPGVAVPARVHRVPGEGESPAVLAFEGPTREAMAVGVSYDAGPVGAYALKTCFLPQRVAPYMLPLELARHRLMRVLESLEEWRLTALPADNPAMRRIEAARERFTRALVEGPVGNGTYDPRQAQLAEEALAAAIEAGDALALEHAGRALRERFEDRASPPPPFGCAVHPERFAEPLQRVLASRFAFMTCPMRWRDIEPSEGKFTFVRTDKWVEWAVRHGKVPVVAGPVLDLAKGGTPEWMHIWRHDYETLRECVYEHVTRVVTRYRRTVSRWTACAGLNLNDDFSLSVDQMVELTRLVIHVIRKLQPSAKVTVDLDQPFGMHTARNTESIPPRLYAELVLDSGLQVDAFGLRVQVGDPAPGRESRDLLQIARMVGDFAELDRPLHITALGAPSERARDGAGGRWHADWSPEVQAEWLAHAATVCAAHPAVQSICWQTLYDAEDPAREPVMPAGGLITSSGAAKPALARAGEIAAALHGRTLPGLRMWPDALPAPA